MVYHYYQWLPSTIIKGVYKIKTHNKAISKFWWFVYDILGRDNNKTWHKQNLYVIGINIDKINQTKISPIAIKSVYYVQYWWPLSNIFPKPLGCNLI